MRKPTIEFTVEQADEILAKLRALPPVESSKRKLNKQGMVNHLAAEISALQGRGYTVEQIAESIRGYGLEISTPTLKSYLQRTKRDAGKTASKAARRTEAKRPATAPAAQGRQPASLDGGGTPKAPAAAVKNAAGEPPNGTPRSTSSEFIATDREKL